LIFKLAPTLRSAISLKILIPVNLDLISSPACSSVFLNSSFYSAVSSSALTKVEKLNLSFAILVSTSSAVSIASARNLAISESSVCSVNALPTFSDAYLRRRLYLLAYEVTLDLVLHLENFLLMVVLVSVVVVVMLLVALASASSSSASAITYISLAFLFIFCTTSSILASSSASTASLNSTSSTSDSLLT